MYFPKISTTGIDILAGSFLKDGSNTLCTPMAKICNLSIKLISFPDKWKVAKVKPFYKKDLKTDPKNFRPISLLPLTPEIMEQIVHDQTMNFLSDDNFLYKNQLGFGKFNSRDSCLSFLNGKITKRSLFWSPNCNGSCWFKKDVRYNWPHHFNLKNAFSRFYWWVTRHISQVEILLLE